MTEPQFVIDKDALQVSVTAEFNATTEQLFRCFTTAALIPQWWGPEKYHTTVAALDVRPGGTWRFEQTDGNETYGFYGEFKELVQNELIVQAFTYAPFPNDGLVETIIFEAINESITRVTDVSRFSSLSALEGMVGSGMREEILNHTLDSQNLLSKARVTGWSRHLRIL